jgi:uncharacterized RDD family membrane protein YckC
MSQISIKTTQNVIIQYQPASLGERIIATILDFLVYLAWILLFFLVLKDNMNETIFYLFLLLPISFYHLTCELFLNGQSIGKRAMNIKVLMTDGSQATWGAYILRWLFRPIDIMIMSGIIGIITVIINGKGQRLGDIAAKTAVVRLKRAVSLEQIEAQKQKIKDHTFTFEKVDKLSDADIQVVQETLKRQNPELLALTAEKIKSVLNINTNLPDREFLLTIIKDHHYLALIGVE